MVGRAFSEKGIKKTRDARTSDGKWQGYPVHYNLVLLSEIDLPSAKAELKHASKTAEKLLKRYRKDDRASLFRKLGLEAASNSV